MCELCDEITDRGDITGHAPFHEDLVKEGEDTFLCCLRPSGHKGPHLVKRYEEFGGKYILFALDYCVDGECYACESEDPSDSCMMYREASSAEEVSRLISDPEFVPDDGWNQDPNCFIECIQKQGK